LSLQDNCNGTFSGTFVIPELHGHLLRNFLERLEHLPTDGFGGVGSEVLDLGRLSRVFNESIKRALSLRHDSCAAEGCVRPFAWCELHHPHAWSKGGVTSLDNALPLCGHHHRRAHDRAYDLSVLASGEVRSRYRR